MIALKNMLTVEKQNSLPKSYLTNSTRKSIVNWITLMHSHYKYNDESLYLTIYLFDSYVSKNTSSKIKLVVMAAFLLAVKYAEYKAPTIRKFLEFTSQKAWKFLYSTA